MVKNRGLVAKLQADVSLGRGEAQAIALALNEKAQGLGIDDKNGINACKLLGVAFTTAGGILIRSREKGLLEESEALEKLSSLAKHGRYKDSIIEDARLTLARRQAFAGIVRTTIFFRRSPKRRGVICPRRFERW